MIWFWIFSFLVTFVSSEIVSDSRAIEKALIAQFEGQGEILTQEDVIRQIGPFVEPTEFVHRNYVDMTNYMRELTFDFPNLTDMYSVGTSVEGRELWVLVISKYPKEHREDVPEFKYVANMHGNEVTGRVFLQQLAWVLLHNYDTNKWIQRLVDTTRIHLMPSMNPDGYERAVEGDDSGVRGRQNANDVDLNRNFPSRFPNFFPSGQIQPETQAVMNWSKKIPFVLSANLHGGTTVVNYPFDDFPTRHRDHIYSPAPDNGIFVRLAYTYARTHTRMWKKGPRCVNDDLNMAIDPQFGIVNGADWYIVSGGMQDWSYLNTNCFEITVELNCHKFPSKKNLKYFWDENKFSLLHFIDQVHNTVHGRIVDGQTGEGVPNVTISIDDESKIIVSHVTGEFWRLVNLGTYEITFDHPLYHSQSRRVTITRDRRSLYLGVSLEKINSTTTAPAKPLPTAEEDEELSEPVDEKDTTETEDEADDPSPQLMDNVVPMNSAIRKLSVFSCTLISFFLFFLF